MWKVLAFVFLIIPAAANAKVSLEKSLEGDYYTYLPRTKPRDILVIAHGMLSKEDNAHKAAKTYLSRWIPYANKHSLLLIVPVFDTPRFGNLGGGYGGYRNLFGKHVAADIFVNKLVDRYSFRTSSASKRFYLYGHSAGGQFVNRYVVTHPNRVIRAVISAAGRYSYPTTSEQWPYGAGALSKTLLWKDGTKKRANITKSLRNYALATQKVSIIIGSRDTKPQPQRPAHVGRDRIQLAKSWAKQMNKNALRHGISGQIEVQIIPNIGHSSSALTPHCVNALFEN
ncbi:hypothetical protein [Thalassotalea montiporae]